jgi:twitching motility protein PilT
MISNMLLQIKNRLSQEVQFRLGHQTILKINNEWTEFDSQILSLADWEDLKDLCLQNNEKVILETKGFVQGVFADPTQTWIFSFTEWKDCMKAHFSYVSKEKMNSNIQFAPYFDSLKKKSGIHFISAQKKNGKSTLLSEIISESRKHSPELVGLHSGPMQISLQNLDSVVHLGLESLNWEGQHPIYDGIETLFVDTNEIQNLNKWVRFAEEGRTVFISLSANSVENVLMQIKSLTQDHKSLWSRFCDQISSIVYQKLVTGHQAAIHEIWILKKEDQRKIFQKMGDDIFSNLTSGATLYQSLNQSILQSIVRRRIDIKTAFEITNDIEDLDRSMKKMGL